MSSREMALGTVSEYETAGGLCDCVSLRGNFFLEAQGSD